MFSLLFTPIRCLTIICALFIATMSTAVDADGNQSLPHKLPDGFVYLHEYYETVVKVGKPKVEPIREHLRYATDENFTGRQVPGYSAKSRAVLTSKAAHALYIVQEAAQSNGYSLLIYDSYRPQKAVNWFVEWASLPDNCDRCRKNYFPYLVNKTVAFELPDRYVAPKSRHSGGSTVDLTLIKLDSKIHHPPTVIARQLLNNQTVNYLSDGTLDMYTSFDLFHHASWPEGQHLIPQQHPYLDNRNLLRKLMVDVGFVPLKTEWWHFTLKDEPFPDKFFDFEF